MLRDTLKHICTAYAREQEFPIVGKLHRVDTPWWDEPTPGYYYYVDEAGNEYHGRCILTANGEVI